MKYFYPLQHEENFLSGRSEIQKSTYCVLLLPQSTKAGEPILAVSRQCGPPWGEGGSWDPGVLACSALLLVAGDMQHSFLGAALDSSSTLYFNKMFQSDIKKWGNI